MFHYKVQTYEQMEKQKPEKKFKQNSYEEIRKLVEENDVERQEINSIVKKITRRKPVMKIHIVLNYLIK